ncbi:LamG-like jellyroll fold domain-containing protein [Streptomyces caelestis]|uniref:LamG-like jellyroll fold domain-containing protein n=1 Tax=Streptomyces caelestis TaxID=36816 RepID=UPI00344DDC49
MPGYRRAARRLLTSRLRRSRWGMALGILLASVIAASSLALSGAGIPLFPEDPRGRSAPDQRWASADGKDHLVGEKDTNAEPPRTLRSKYPTTVRKGSLAAAGKKARNKAEVVDPPATEVTGFDPGRSEELPAERDGFSRTYANEDGTRTTEMSPTPVNYRDAEGDWQPIDTELRADGDGWRNTADSVGVRIDRRADSARLATVELPGGRGLSYGLSGAAGVQGSADGGTVTYEGVLADTDLTLESQAGGIKETLVLNSADAPTTFDFPLDLDGLTARIADGAVELTDAEGRVAGVIPAGFMEDSGHGGEQGAPARSEDVSYDLVEQADGGRALRITVDADWLRDPERVFPVKVDPSVDTSSAETSVYVKSGGSVVGTSELQVGKGADGATATYLGFPSLDEELRHHKIFGAQLQLTNYDSASCKARPVSVHPVTESWSAGTGLGYPGPAVGGSLASKSFAYGYIATGRSKSACPAASELFDLGKAGRDLVQRWVDGTQANHGLSVRASATDSLAWKKFAGHGTANPPKLYVTHSPYNASYSFTQPVPDPPVLQNQAGQVKVAVTNKGAGTWTPGAYYLAYRAYDKDGKLVTQQRAANLTTNVAHGARTTFTATIKALPPGAYMLDFSMVKSGGPVFTDEQVAPGRLSLQVFDIAPVVQEQHPPNGYQAQTLSPQLWAHAVDIDAPAGQTLQYKFEVCEQGDDDQPVDCTTSAYQTSPAYTVPAGRLSWNKTYLWRGFAKDASNEVPTARIALLTSVPQPEITSRLSEGRDLEFDPQVGNYATSAIDASLAGAGPDMTLVRTYNSLDPRRDLVFGTGWTTRYDIRLTPDDDGTGNVVIRYPDGRDVRFGKNPDGSYAPPPGRFAKLTRDTTAGTWTLQDKSGTTYSFSNTGLLVRITDATSNVVTYTYSGGRLAKAENPRSKRSLTFTWTGAHVTRVATNAVDGAALAWTYSYTGDVLDQVCDPTGGCTAYTYTAGSHYAAGVRDARPESYWRLGEETGATSAESAIEVNLGKDRGTHTDVTLGATGAVTGDPSTAAGFNGTTSRVTLPGGTLKASRDAAVEMWFKTIAGGVGGPLIGYQDKAWGTAPGTGVPTLYVGTDGKLRGQFWDGTAHPMTAATTNVNDGKWHHVVLSVSGSTQTLYLDGKQAATLAGGQIQAQKLTHNQIGAARPSSPASWPGWGGAQGRSFAGSIDEVAVYHHPLGSQAVSAHHALGTGAADLLTRTTLPSGRTAAEVTYDTARDRVSEYTDANGGTWAVGAPAVFGDEDDLRRTVEVHDPVGQPYFYEYDGMTSQLLRYGEPLGLGTRQYDETPEPSPSTSAPTEICTEPDPGDPMFCTTPPGNDDGSPDFIRHPVDGVAIRSYTYDDRGYQTVTTSETGDTVTLGYDDRGNVDSQTTCRAKGDCHTSYTTYPAGLDELDLRIDLPTETRDARSTSATDNRYLTTYEYDANGNLLSQKNPDGGSVVNTYTTGVEPARDGGNTPTGLLKTSTDPRGAVTRYAYFNSGDIAEVTEPSGLVTRYTYDAIGRRTSETEISDSRPDGVTTTYRYDKLSRLVTSTDPQVGDAVTGAQHQQRTTTTYDPDGVVTATGIDDVVGADLPRSMTYELDDHGRPVRVTDAEGNETSYGYDPFGNQTFMVDGNGNRFEYAYTARNMIAEVRLVDWDGDPEDADGSGEDLVLQSYAYDMAGRLAQHTDAMGRTLEYQYYGDDLVKSITLKGFHNADGTTRDIVVEANEYDGAGNVTKETTDNGRTVTRTTYDPVGRVASTVTDPDGLARSTAYTYDRAGNVITTRNSGNPSHVPWPVSATPEQVDYVYDLAGNATKEITHNGSETLTTTYAYDQRGLTKSVTDPAGNVTDYGYDALGRQISTLAPEVDTEQNGGAVRRTRPLTVVGLDTYGAATSVQDPLGDVTRTEYDRLGRRISTTGAAYTAPGTSTPVTPTAQYRYDALGNVVEATDPLDQVTRYSYDRLNRVTVRDEPTGTGDDRAQWKYTYTRTGEVLSVTGPTGARAETTYDDLDRPVTRTQIDRKPYEDAFTTRYTYDDAGNVTEQTDPSGARTSFTYDGLGQVTRLTEPSGTVTEFGYDLAGREVRRSDGLGRTSSLLYDQAGRLVSESDLAPDSDSLRTIGYDYDDAGNLTASTDPLGHTTRYAYDALGRLTRQTEPVTDTESLTTSFGYDAAGHRTRYTDGRGNSTHYTFNTLGLAESVIEPATAADPDAADRTWTTAYDAAGQAIRATAPGGVTRDRVYDHTGRLIEETGTGAEAATADRSYGYDAAGRLTSAGTPDGDNTYTYNDRGLLLSAEGPSGEASYAYDDDGLLTSRTDATGTALFTYTRQQLSTAKDSLTGTGQSYAYDTSGMLRRVSYGAGQSRTYGYDDLGRIDTDTLTNDAGRAVTSIDYGYDDNDHLTSKKVTGSNAADNTYGYDQAGRLTSWTADGDTTTYAWDASGNRTREGDKTAVYDERNRVRSDGDYTYTYSARGTLASRTSSGLTEDFAFDAFDRLLQAGDVSYAYDSLDRVDSRNGTDFTYAGLSPDPVGDGASSYGRGPLDELMSVSEKGTAQLVLTDSHGDVVGDFDAADGDLTELAGSTTYSPFGEELADEGTGSGVSGELGYQGDYTDPDTGQVNMGARWYDSGTGTFDSRDSVDYAGGASILANRYTYGAGAPLDYVDADGHWPSCGWCKKVASGVKKVGSAIKSGVKKAARAVKTVVKKAWRAAVSAVKAVGRAISNAAKWVYNKARSAVRWVAQKVSSAVGWVASKATSAAKSAAAWAREKAAAAKRAAVARAKAITKKAKAAVSYAIQHSPLPEIAAAVKPLISVTKDIVSAAANLPAQVVDTARNVIADAAQAATDLRDAVVAAAGEVVETVSSAVQAATEFARAAAPMIRDGLKAGLEIAAEASGFNDFKNCLTKGDMEACAWAAATVAGALAGGVGAGAVRAAKAGRMASKAAKYADKLDTAVEYTSCVADGASLLASANSFTEGTLVLMADGSRKPIEDVDVGDEVKATDPTTGKTSSEEVTATITGEGEKNLVDLTIDTDGAEGDATAVLTATEGHPFWVPDLGEWLDAGDLKPGQWLSTGSGTKVQLTAVRAWTRSTTVHNLTVDRAHTFFVAASGTSVLVHNCPSGTRGPQGKFKPTLVMDRAQGNWDMDTRISDATAMRDEVARAATGKAKSRTYTAAVHKKTGDVAVSCSGNGSCAEPNILNATGWSADDVTFTRAVRREDVDDGLGKILQEKEICVVCQGNYEPDNFVPGVLYDPAGPWMLGAG